MERLSTIIAGLILAASLANARASPGTFIMVTKAGETHPEGMG